MNPSRQVEHRTTRLPTWCSGGSLPRYTCGVAFAGVTQLVECLPSKQTVASSSLVPRSIPTLQVSATACLHLRPGRVLPQRFATI